MDLGIKKRCAIKRWQKGWRNYLQQVGQNDSGLWIPTRYPERKKQGIHVGHSSMIVEMGVPCRT